MSIEKLDMATFCALSRLGVTEIHLTEDACEKLCDELRGLYVPSGPPSQEEQEAIDAGWAGQLAGIRFYRDLSAA